VAVICWLTYNRSLLAVQCARVDTTNITGSKQRWQCRFHEDIVKLKHSNKNVFLCFYNSLKNMFLKMFFGSFDVFYECF